MQSADQLLLKVGSPVGVPPAGHKSIFADTDGNVKVIDETGSKAAVGGAVGWDALQWQRAQVLLGSQVDNYIWSDLLFTSEYDITSGSGPFAQLAASTGGVVKNGAGTATLYFAGQKNGAATIVPIPNIKTSAWAVAARCRLDATPTGAGKLFDFAAMLGSSQYASLCCDVNTSATVLQIQLVGGATTSVACNAAGTIGSGITVGTWFDALLVNNPSAGSVTAQINGVTVASTTTLTNLTTQAGGPFFDTNQNTAMSVDSIFMAFKREP